MGQRRRGLQGPTKRVVRESFAVAEARQAATDMLDASARACPLGLEMAQQAAILYGRASARLGDTHPVLRESYRELHKHYGRLLKRCSR